MYDAESQELIKELQGTSRVMSVAIWDGGKDGGRDTNQSESLIVAGFQSLGFKSGIQDGTIQVWDSSAPRAQNCPSAKIDACLLVSQARWS